ncbi:MAG: PilN domain-containing protein [Zoogloeaceae bacterium]|nr:PilN domain-containing protein [Zoogloeaceae bacterium]
MIRINLLPYREERRKALRQQFFALAGLAVLAAILIIVMGHAAIAGYTSQQEKKNAFLKKNIATLDKDLDEIKRLKTQTSALLSRKTIIEDLQVTRAETVQLLNELARQVPPGVYLKSLKQTGSKISLNGTAQSSARIANLMRNLEASPLLENPDLVEIKAVTQGSRGYSEFNLNVTITHATSASDGKPAAGAQPPKQDKKA